MSVYIKGMEMPTSCGECDLCACYVREDGTEENYRCPITMYPVHNFDERLDNCPLIPVPEHGRLIDADALQVDMMEMVASGMYGEEDCIDAVIEAPTIIPADKEEEG